jgi:hypothetical protein
MKFIIMDFLQFYIPSSPLNQTIFSTLIPKPSAYVLPLIWKIKFHTHIKKRQNNISVYLLYS